MKNILGLESITFGFDGLRQERIESHSLHLLNDYYGFTDIQIEVEEYKIERKKKEKCKETAIDCQVLIEGLRNREIAYGE